jgi:hypothetical protein
MENLEFTLLETHIYNASGSFEVTLRRRKMVLVSGTLFALVLLIGTLVVRRWEVPLCVGLFYIAMTVFEKIAYANAVLGYKRVVQKLRRRIEELEAKGTLPASDPT